MPLIYRVQDATGRGPYRPGYSHLWTDSMHEMRNPTFMQEFPWLRFKLRVSDDAFGCGFRDLGQVLKWFSGDEIRRLGERGFQLVMLDVDEILAESERQLVFWRSKPLNKYILRVIPWAEPQCQTTE